MLDMNRTGGQQKVLIAESKTQHQNENQFSSTTTNYLDSSSGSNYRHPVSVYNTGGSRNADSSNLRNARLDGQANPRLTEPLSAEPLQYKTHDKLASKVDIKQKYFYGFINIYIHDNLNNTKDWRARATAVEEISKLVEID